jgi:hypothetical protein
MRPLMRLESEPKSGAILGHYLLPQPLSPEPPCPQGAVSDVPPVSEVKGNFTVIKKQDAVSHYDQVSKGKMDYTLRENRKSLACSHLHADSVRERVNAGWRDLGKKLKDADSNVFYV